jgi:hypothetical protein
MNFLLVIGAALVYGKHHNTGYVIVNKKSYCSRKSYCAMHKIITEKAVYLNFGVS